MIELIKNYSLFVGLYLLIGTAFAAATSQPQNMLTAIFKTLCWPWVIAMSILYVVREKLERRS